MYTFIIVIHVSACLMLIAAILLQSGRGAGLSDLFGGGASQTIFGTRASTFLTRATTVAAVTFLLTCITLTIFSSRQGRSLLEGKKPVSEEPKSEAKTSESEIDSTEVDSSKGNFQLIPKETQEEKAETNQAESKELPE